MTAHVTDHTAASLRAVFGAFPSGVAAVCALQGGERVGMAISTFSPVSIDPPLASVCIQNTSATWKRLKTVPRLGVSILGQNHERTCLQLSTKEADRFDGVQTVVTATGAIQVVDACAWFDCSVEAEIAAGDHIIVVLRIEQTDQVMDSAPLIFHGSRFRRLADA